jgi:chromosome segregation ATPase
MSLDPATAIVDLDTRLKALDGQLSDKRRKYQSTALPAAFMAGAAKDRERLRGELETLAHNRDELAEARAEAARQIDETERTSFIAQQHARKMAAQKARSEAHARARKAATDLGAAADAFIKASVALHAENAAVSPGAHEQLSMLPRRVLSALFHELVGRDCYMHNFTIEDGIDHWEPSLGHVGHFLRAAADPVMPS